MAHVAWRFFSSCLLAGTIYPTRCGFSLDPRSFASIERAVSRKLPRCSKRVYLLVYWNISGAGRSYSSAFHETGYARGVEIGVVPLDPLPIVLIVATAVSSRPPTTS